MNEEVLEVAQEATEAPQATSEPVEVPEVAPKAKKAHAVKESPRVIRAEAGDSYVSIGLRYAVDPRELVRINNNRPIREGVKVFLKEQ